LIDVYGISCIKIENENGEIAEAIYLNKDHSYYTSVNGKNKKEQSKNYIHEIFLLLLLS